VGVADDVRSEYHQLAATLTLLGPDAPGGVPNWSAREVAAHIRAQASGGGVVVYLGRRFVERGIRVNDRAGPAADRVLRYYRRRPFDSLVATIAAGPSRVFVRPSIAHVTLFEVWVHHDDLRRANGLPTTEPDSLTATIDWALRYQRDALVTELDRSMSAADQLRWLTGRPAAQPAHDPPLRI
jgi:uncharacterized protein (TIGR03083 family)